MKGGETGLNRNGSTRIRVGAEFVSGTKWKVLVSLLFHFSFKSKGCFNEWIATPEKVVFWHAVD